MVDKQLCVLCGVNEATKGKGDHLPPQNIYPRPRKPNIELNTVPACTPCNQAGSTDDEEFKLVIGLTTGEFRVEQALVIESMAKTMGGNKKLARKLLKKAQHVWARNPAGLLIPMVGVSFDRSSYSRVIERIIKGLYWQHTGQIMPKRKVLVVHGDEPEGQLVSAIKRVLQMIDPVALNGGTFVYKVSFTDNNDESFWALQFFKKHTVFATVLPESVPAVS